jgi:ribonuclease HII
MLKVSFTENLVECGCDEAGRGCLAGPVFAAAVILPPDFRDNSINDSKILSRSARDRLRVEIEREALAWSVAWVSNIEIDEINILNASILAMHKAISTLKVEPQLLLIDGNRFNAYGKIPHQCIVKGDSLFLSIAAASILAKTHRDEFMKELAGKYPEYGWNQNKGYPTVKHRRAIIENGFTPFHRRTFSVQLKLF